MVNTLVYSIGGTVGAIGLGLVAALALRRPFRGRGTRPGCMLLPYVAPVVAATFVWTGRCSTRSSASSTTGGTTLLGWDEPIAVPRPPHGVTCSGSSCTEPAMLTVIVFEAWRYFPFAFLFLPPGCWRCRSTWRRRPRSDGATATQRFRYIVVCRSCCRRSRCSAVLRFILTFNKFDDIYLLTGGGAGTEVVSVRVYDYLTARKDVGGRRSAQALVLAARPRWSCVTVYLQFAGRSEEVA